jgi:ribose/xylose/arabinose/galactoside ABC-type transport system permease subunit
MTHSVARNVCSADKVDSINHFHKIHVREWFSGWWWLQWWLILVVMVVVLVVLVLVAPAVRLGWWVGASGQVAEISALSNTPATSEEGRCAALL